VVLAVGAGLPTTAAVAARSQHRAAELLTGPRRYSTFGQLDVDIMRTEAPWAAPYVPNIRELVSARVGCYIFQASQAIIDLANVCLVRCRFRPRRRT
jgi:hypothetical protein